MDNNITKKIVSGMKWKMIERLSIQVVNAITPIVLARLLAPSDFGAVAILTVFISLANTFVNNGLSGAIIQRQNADELDCSTVFFTQLGIALIAYAILFISAPFIADFYDNAELSIMLRIMSLSIPIGALSSMQMTVLKKNMEFNKSFAANVMAMAAYSIVGITAAYCGFGCWSLVLASIANQVFLFIGAAATVRWHPHFMFSLSRLKSLFGYSWKLFVGWMIGTLHQDLYSLVIGKRFSSAMLGFYNRAGSFPTIILKTVTEIVDGVMFPALSKVQDEKGKFVEMTKQLLSINAYILFPVFFGLAATSENIISILLTDKWLPSAPMMCIMCVTYSLNSLNNSNMQVFNSMGRSDIFMKFELIKRSISIALLLIVSLINIYAVLLVLTAMAVLSNLMNAYQNKKLFGISYREQFSNVIPYFLAAAVMAIAVFFAGRMISSRIVSLAVQLVSGIIIYGAISVVFKFKPFKELTSILRIMLIKKEKRINDEKGHGACRE